MSWSSRESYYCADDVGQIVDKCTCNSQINVYHGKACDGILKTSHIIVEYNDKILV